MIRETGLEHAISIYTVQTIEYVKVINYFCIHDTFFQSLKCLDPPVPIPAFKNIKIVYANKADPYAFK